MTDLEKLEQLAKAVPAGPWTTRGLSLLSRLRQAEKKISIEVYQQDWIPGFAAFHDDGESEKWGKHPEARPHIVLNLAANLQTVEAGDVPKSELPYIIAESLMHEIIHVFEAWAKVEFNEDRVEELLAKYRAKYSPDSPQYIKTLGEGWIAVETMMPENGKRVFVGELAKSYKRVTIGIWAGSEWIHGDKESGHSALGNVIAWQPLPAPPQAAQEEK